MIKPVPTKRAMIEVGMKCNIGCMFCYYHHLGDLKKLIDSIAKFLQWDIENR